MIITALKDRGLVRLIPATYHKPPSLRGLVDSDEELEILAEIEGLTSARLIAERGLNLHLDRRELAWKRRRHDLQELCAKGARRPEGAGRRHAAGKRAALPGGCRSYAQGQVGTAGRGRGRWCARPTPIDRAKRP